jgi:hypothetical protein
MIFPLELLKEAFKQAQQMPQLVIPIPSGYSVTGRLEPPSGSGWVYTGFMFGGHLADGTAIPGYNFVTEKGIVWKASYVNVEPLRTFVDRTFYLTSDYLYKQIFYGPKPVTKFLEVTATNTLDQPVYFSNTAFVFELPIDRIMALFYTKG